MIVLPGLLHSAMLDLQGLLTDQSLPQHVNQPFQHSVHGLQPAVLI
jgi:hypothetical protein